MEYIAYVETPYKEKFGIPRQSGLAESTCGEIIFTPKFRNPDAVRGIEEFSHLWLLWEFSRAKQDTFHATVAPPRLGGKEKRGVFATRSPFRPNSIGLSCVKLEKVRIDQKLGPVLTVSGLDLLDHTPLFDIKPYLPYVDAHPEAKNGFAEEFRDICGDRFLRFLHRIPGRHTTKSRIISTGWHLMIMTFGLRWQRES